MRTHPIISDFHNLSTTVVSDVTHITNILKSTVSVRLSSSPQHCQAYLRLALELLVSKYQRWCQLTQS